MHSPSFLHCCSDSITEGHWVGQPGLVLGDAVLAVPSHLPVPPRALAQLPEGAVP